MRCKIIAGYRIGVERLNESISKDVLANPARRLHPTQKSQINIPITDVIHLCIRDPLTDADRKGSTPRPRIMYLSPIPPLIPFSLYSSFVRNRRKDE